MCPHGIERYLILLAFWIYGGLLVYGTRDLNRLEKRNRAICSNEPFKPTPKKGWRSTIRPKSKPKTRIEPKLWQFNSHKALLEKN